MAERAVWALKKGESNLQEVAMLTVCALIFDDCAVQKKKKKNNENRPTEHTQHEEGEPKKGPPAPANRTEGQASAKRRPGPPKTKPTKTMSGSRSQLAVASKPMYHISAAEQIASTSDEPVGSLGANVKSVHT